MIEPRPDPTPEPEPDRVLDPRPDSERDTRPDYQPDYGSQPPPSFPPSSKPRSVSLPLPGPKPFLVWVIMGLNIAIYGLQFVSLYFLNNPELQLWGVKSNAAIIAGQYWRLFTPMFLHGSPLHAAFNMYALYIFGPGLERRYGHARFLALYILSGFAGNVMSFLFSPANSLGSSTAIFGLLGAEGIFLYQNREIFGQMGRRALNNIVMVAALNFFIGLSPGIDNWGHLGGLLGGLLFAASGGPVLKVQGTYPDLEVVDVRPPVDILRAGISVALLFIALTASNIYLHTR